jgi:hypothetical protein
MQLSLIITHLSAINYTELVNVILEASGYSLIYQIISPTMLPPGIQSVKCGLIIYIFSEIYIPCVEQ